MCGIVAYLGKKPAQPILIESLKRLEYRGYDSAGIALLRPGGISVKKTSGRIAALEQILEAPRGVDTLGIAHTRWATHGVPNTINAHPHMDGTGKIAVVHNGIIENYGTLKTWLQSEGVAFLSETDTEVLANLIGYLYRNGDPAERCGGQNQFEWAVQQALQRVHGTYGVAVLCADVPDTIIGAKRGSPLIVGVGDGEYIVASDAAAIVEHTTQVIYLTDNEMVVIGADGFRTMTIDNVAVTKEVKQIEFSLEQIELGGYEHFMLKEIFEQPEALSTCLRGRLDQRGGKIVLGGIADHAARAGAGQADHPHRLRHGLARRAGRASTCSRTWPSIPAEAEYASEFRYRNPIIEDGTVVIAISQSGETADTLAALREAKEKGATGAGRRQRRRLAPSPARPTPASTCTSGRRSAWPAPRPSPARWRC